MKKKEKKKEIFRFSFFIKWLREKKWTSSMTLSLFDFMLIFKTEAFYVNQLLVFAELLLKPLIENWAKKTQRAQLIDLRSKVESVYKVNCTLLQVLEQRLKSWMNNKNIGDVFMTIVPFLKIYRFCDRLFSILFTFFNPKKIYSSSKTFENVKKWRDYTITYSSALPFFSKLLVDDSFVNFCGDLKNKHKEIRGDLSSYAIQPIQRVPRYELLLRELLKETDKNHADYADITKALNEVNSVAVFVNESISKSKNTLKLLEIQNLVQDPSVTNSFF